MPATWIATADLDLVSANMAGSGGACTVLLNDGDAGFGAGIAVGNASGLSASNLELGDLNGDGILDIATSDLNQSRMYVYYGTGDGTAQESVGARKAISLPYGVLLADLDRDGLLDLGGCSWADVGTVTIWRNTTVFDRGLGFASAETTAAGSAPRTVDSGDFDRDGNPDLLVCSGNADGATVLFGDGAGGVRNSTQFSAGTGAFCARFADINRNGCLDIVLADYGTSRVYLMTGDGAGGLVGTSWMHLRIARLGRRRGLHWRRCT